MTPHIEAQPGDYADTVLLPGDPLRAKWIAETFFDNPVQVNSVRNCFGYTGEYQGERISVQAGGMGMPSNSIYITELFKDYNVKTIIRVGSCGGIAKHIKVGDIVAATTATTDSAMGKTLIPGFQYSPSVDYDLLTLKQEEETRKLINFIGLSWEDKCMAPQDNNRSVATASNIQVRQKVYQGSSEQWKKYQPFLNGALDGLSSA